MARPKSVQSFDSRYGSKAELELLSRLAEAAAQDVSLRLRGEAEHTPSHAVYGPLLDAVNEWQEFKILKKQAVAEFLKRKTEAPLKHSKMTRKETYPIEAVLPFVVDDVYGPFEMKRDYDGDLMHMASSRYRCFKFSGLSCVRCGIKGSFFAKERGSEPGRSKYNEWHFNLYAVNSEGNEVLMTKDHLHPKSKGGTDDNANLQTLCNPCNNNKSDQDGLEWQKKHGLTAAEADACGHSSQPPQSPEPQS